MQTSFKRNLLGVCMQAPLKMGFPEGCDQPTGVHANPSEKGLHGVAH